MEDSDHDFREIENPRKKEISKFDTDSLSEENSRIKNHYINLKAPIQKEENVRFIFGRRIPSVKRDSETETDENDTNDEIDEVDISEQESEDRTEMGAIENKRNRDPEIEAKENEEINTVSELKTEENLLEDENEENSEKVIDLNEYIENMKKEMEKYKLDKNKVVNPSKITQKNSKESQMDLDRKIFDIKIDYDLLRAKISKFFKDASEFCKFAYNANLN